MSGLRIGLGPFPLERSRGLSLRRVYGRTLDLAELAERVGLDSVWVDGNHFSDQAHGPSPLLAAAALAARTRRVAIGIATLTLSIGEHPLHVAEQALVLDALSGGRLVLGVGLGYRAAEMAGFGVDPALRRDRFDDALAVLRAAFAEPPGFPAGGAQFRVEVPVVPQPRPVQPGGPPIWVGGGWRPAAVRRVARLGFPLVSQFFEGLDRIVEKQRLYRETAAPDAPGHSTVPVIRDVVLAEPEAVQPALLRVYRRYASWGMPLLGRPTRPDEIGPAQVGKLALVGSEAHLEAGLAALRDAGVTHVLARADLPGIPRATVESSVRALGRIRTRLGS